MFGEARLVGLIVIVPISVLLTISFFVLVVLRKVEDTSLKAFGKFVAGLLWAAALLLFAAGMFILITGHYPMKRMMTKCLLGKGAMGSGMMKDCPMMKKAAMPSHAMTGASVDVTVSGAVNKSPDTK